MGQSYKRYEEIKSSDLKLDVDADVPLNVNFLELSSDSSFRIQQEKLTNLQCSPVKYLVPEQCTCVCEGVFHVVGVDEGQDG